MPEPYVMTLEEESEMRLFYVEHDALCRKHGVVTLDMLFRDLETSGYKVNNFFQTRGEKPFWRVSLCYPKAKDTPDFEFEYGDGWTPEEALENALHNARLVRRHGNMRNKTVMRRIRRDFCTGGTLLAKELDEFGH